MQFSNQIEKITKDLQSMGDFLIALAHSEDFLQPFHPHHKKLKMAFSEWIETQGKLPEAFIQFSELFKELLFQNNAIGEYQEALLGLLSEKPRDLLGKFLDKHRAILRFLLIEFADENHILFVVHDQFSTWYKGDEPAEKKKDDSSEKEKIGKWNAELKEIADKIPKRSNESTANVQLMLAEEKCEGTSDHYLLAMEMLYGRNPKQERSLEEVAVTFKNLKGTPEPVESELSYASLSDEFKEFMIRGFYNYSDDLNLTPEEYWESLPKEEKDEIVTNFDQRLSCSIL